MSAPGAVNRRWPTGDLTLLGITALWGLTFVLVKDALADADPLTFLTLRFSLGAVVAGAVAGSALRNRAAWRAGLFLGALLFVGFALQTFGLEGTTPARSAFITGLSVILVPFVSTALSRRVPPASAALGALLAVAGLVQLTQVSLEGPFPPGDVLTLLGAFAYALHIGFTERLSGRGPATAIVAVQLAVTAACSAALLPWAPLRLNPTWGLALAVVLTGVFASALAISLQTWAQARTTAVRAAVIFSLESVFAALYSAALGREAIGGKEVIGGGLILLGVIVSELGPSAWRHHSQNVEASADPASGEPPRTTGSLEDTR